MVIFEDTRNQYLKHTNKGKWFKENGYEVIRTKLPYGDYQLPNGNVFVDTKKDMLELLSNLTKDHARFRNELMLAQKCNSKLYILVEEGNYLTLKNIHLWKSPIRKGGVNKGLPFSNANMIAVQKMMITIENKYNCKFVFCNKSDSAKVIIKILKGEYNDS